MIVEVTDASVVPAIREFLKGVQEIRTLILYKRYFVATSGDERYVDVERIRTIPGVISIVDTVKHPFYFASRDCQTEDTVIPIGEIRAGDRGVVVIAGPCAVENLEDTLATAEAVQAAGARLFRAGASKPRTTPYNFQGLGKAGFEILADVRQRTGLRVVSEVMSPEDITAAADCVDVLQVGARNMTNTSLLKNLGSSQKPVLLKRGASATLVDLLKAAEYIIYGGNHKVILCERGIKTHETATRFTLDLSAVPMLKKLSHLPVIVDPSHATGHSALVPVMAKCALVAGADGLLVEVHVDPDRMIRPGDAKQALRPAEFAALMDELRVIAGSIGRSIP